MQQQSVWQPAAGSCGFHVGTNQVHAAHVGGIALFAFESRLSTPEKPYFTCMAVGHTYFKGETLEEVTAAGESYARRRGKDAVCRALPPPDFRAVILSDLRLPLPAEEENHDD